MLLAMFLPRIRYNLKQEGNEEVFQKSKQKQIQLRFGYSSNVALTVLIDLY